ncbi:MAG TPA: COX15/CtaA family protein [Gaiellaceae bacterium]
MSTAASAAPRRLELSEARFRHLAWWTVGWLILIIATGATVRVTGSGLGCHHWPGCAAGEFLPAQGYHSDVEFGNRVVASLTVFTTLVFAVGATLARRRVALAWLVFAGTLAQAPLGAITIHYGLNPYLVITHLLLSLVVLGLGVAVAAAGDAPPLPDRARLAGALLLAATAFLVVTGTLATASGRFPGSSGDKHVRRIGAFDPAVALHVKAVATFGACFLLLAAWAWLHRARYPWLVRGCAGLLVILAAQMAIGEMQYRLYGSIPWAVVLLHVAVAASLFAWAVGLVTRVWRPIRN